MDLIQLIEEIEDLIDDASSLPFSKKVMVDADELFEIVKEMRQSLPEEVKQAQWIADEKDRILSEAEREADQIRADAQKEADRIANDAHMRFESMVNEHDVTKQAEKYGQEIVAKADQMARTTKMQSITYVDELLASTQERLKGLLEVLEQNRNELRKN